MSEVKRKLFSSDVFTLAALLAGPVILAAVFFTVLSGGKAPPKQNAPEASFCDGSTWNSIDALSLPVLERRQMKAALLKVTIESSALLGVSDFNVKSPLPEYVSLIDSFYEAKENAPIPLFFALRIADMEKNGADRKTVIAFRADLIGKLKSSGLLPK